jgi:hypothetical protein
MGIAEMSADTRNHVSEYTIIGGLAMQFSEVNSMIGKLHSHSLAVCTPLMRRRAATVQPGPADVPVLRSPS